MRQFRRGWRQPWLLGPLVLAGLSALALALPAAGAGSAVSGPRPGRYPAHIMEAGSLGNATDATALAASATGGLPAGGVLGDVTGDRLADILAVDPSGNLWLYPNTGSAGAGLFGGRSKVGIGWGGYTVAAVARLYGEFAAGILAIDPAGNLWYYHNLNGTGLSTFGQRLKVGSGWIGYTVIGLTDLYSTGDPGVLAIDRAGNLWYYPGTGGTGTATFGARSLVGIGWTGHTADATDITGDGNPDILAVDSAGRMWLYPNTGSGTGLSTFGTPSQLGGPGPALGAGWTGYQAVDAGLLTSSAFADILAIDAGGDLWYYPSTDLIGDVTFNTRIQVGSGWTGYTIN